MLGTMARFLGTGYWRGWERPRLLGWLLGHDWVPVSRPEAAAQDQVDRAVALRSEQAGLYGAVGAQILLQISAPAGLVRTQAMIAFSSF